MIKQYSPAMESALRQLFKLVDNGVEFPDATAKICAQTGFMSHELINAYDIRSAERSTKRADMTPVTITHRPAMKGAHYSAREWVGIVHDAGNFTKCHETDPHQSVDAARESARAWAVENGYTVQERE